MSASEKIVAAERAQPVSTKRRFSLIEKFGIVFFGLIGLLLAVVPQQPKRTFMVPGQSPLAPLEVSLRENASSFIKQNTSGDGQLVPSLKESSWQGRPAITLNWEWNTLIAADKDSLIIQVKNVFKGIAKTNGLQAELLELRIFCSLSDQYGKESLGRCARIIMPISELKKIEYSEIMNKQLSNLIKKNDGFSSDNQAMRLLWDKY